MSSLALICMRITGAAVILWWHFSRPSVNMYSAFDEAVLPDESPRTETRLMKWGWVKDRVRVSGRNGVVPIMLDNYVQAICSVSAKQGYCFIIPYPFF